MINIVTSLARALGVMHYIQADGELQRTPTRWYIEAYQNGREQGFLVSTFLPHKPTYFVAQQRNSDRLIIYKGSYAFQGLSEDAYKNYQEFNTADETGDWLIEDILDNSEKAEE